MKKRLVCIGLALALLAGLSLTAAAEDLELPAPSCILMEKQTGQVLYESNAHEKLRPASVTKVMTLLLVMEAPRPLPREAARSISRKTSSCR